MGKDLKGKELGKGILQKKSGNYEARFTNRFGKRVSITGLDLKDVKRRFNEAIYEDEKEINIRNNIKLNEWYEKWMGVYKYDSIRENTKRYYSQIYKKHIAPTLGNSYIHNISQLQIRELLKKLKKQGYQFETVNKARVLLVDMFNKAMNDEFVRRNPAKGITIKRDEKKDIRVLSVEDQIDFFNCCKGTFYDNFFIVALQTGMRVGELAALRWKDIDWDKNEIIISRTLVYQKYEGDTQKTFHFEPPKTKTSYRTIPISKICEMALKKQFVQKRVVEVKAPPSKKPDEKFRDLLFTTTHNTPLNAQTAIDAIERIVNEINLTRDFIDEFEPFSCHCFRHTFATRCFESGIKPKTVQSYLGHASLQMTMDLYTTVLPEHMHSEINKLEESFDEFENIDFEHKLIEQKYNASNMLKKVVNFGDYLEYRG